MIYTYRLNLTCTQHYTSFILSFLIQKIILSLPTSYGAKSLGHLQNKQKDKTAINRSNFKSKHYGFTLGRFIWPLLFFFHLHKHTLYLFFCCTNPNPINKCKTGWSPLFRQKPKVRSTSSLSILLRVRCH